MKRKHRNIGDRVHLIVDEVLHLLGHSSPSCADAARGRSLQLTRLEERVLMSASPMAMVAEVAMVAVETPPVTDAVETGMLTSAATENIDCSELDVKEPSNTAIAEAAGEDSENPADTAEAVSGIELIVIDSRVQDADTLLASLLNTDRDFRLLRLDANEDGLTQITEKLEKLGNVSAIHLLAHGREGEILLGSTLLNAGTLAQHTPELLAWQHSLTANADLLLYGCDVAGSIEGQNFVESLSRLTGADVAASTNATGSSLYGGDWDLEYDIGAIETHVFGSSLIIGDWHDLLGVITVSTTNDVLDGDTSSVASLLGNKGLDGLISLREAIIAANNSAGADTIFLTAGTFTFSIGGQGENATFSGDLDITDSLTIIGAGSGLSIIDANALDRVFEVHAGITATIEDVTIRGGVMASSDFGGGVLVDNAANLNLTRVVITGNSSGSGAGVYNYGTLVATDTSITNNTASDWGGGLYNDRGSVTLNRVTLSGNTAGKDGGGINNAGSGAAMSLINVTLSGNIATGDGGGLWTSQSMTATNVTIAFNEAASGDGIFMQGGGADVRLRNSVLYNTSGVNANRALTSLGNNIDSGFTAGLAGPADQSGINPLLDATLQNNGGFVATHRLLSGSAAIDSGTRVSAPTVDARNTSRDMSPDIGAYEVQGLFARTSESLVNTTNTNTQSTSSESRGSTHAVAVARDGSYVVVWSSMNQDGDSSGVYGQRFDAAGNKLGGEFLINQTTIKDQRHATVAMNGRGDFVVSWTSVNQDGSTNGVYARRYDAAGTALGGEFLVNATINGDQDSPVVAMASDGRFLIVWEGNGPGDSNGIFGRWYAANGAPSSSEVLINTTILGQQHDPSVAMAADGNAVVVWSDATGVWAQRFDANGVATGSGIQVELSPNAGSPDVAMAADGSFVVAYRATFLNSDVDFRRYDVAGTVLTPMAQTANTTTASDQTNPSITMNDTGDFLIVWEGNGALDSDGVFGRLYAANGNPLKASEFQINGTTTGTQSMASAAMLSGTHFVVAWSGVGAADSSGVYARQFANTLPTITAIPDQSIAEDASTTSLSFNIADLESLASDLVVMAVSSDSSLVLPGGFVFAGTGANRTISVTPTANQSGTATITVMVSDEYATSSTLFLLTVTPVDDAPAFTSSGGGPTASVSVFENVTAVTTVYAVDPDVPAQSLTYSISGGTDAAKFAISSTTGVLTFVTAPNYEDPADTGLNNVYDVIVQVSDGALIDTQAIAVTVTAVNDNTPVITSNGGGVSATVSISENVTAVTTVTATDADLPAQTLTYSISGGPDAARFRINGSSGVLKFDVAPNFELPTDVDGNHVYNVTVQVSDGNGRIDTQAIEVTVTDLNDTAPVVSPAQAFNVSELADNGFSLGAVQAADADTFGNLQSWAIVSGNNDGVFGINAVTGQLIVSDNTNLNFELTNKYTLGIRVGDGVNTSATANVVVNVTNVNESPTITAIANRTILEAGNTGQLAFTIGDPETTAGSLTITATSSNQTMIPNANLVIAGTGANRTITATPTVGQSGGPVTITLTVSDGTFQAQEIFEVTVLPRVITVTTMADENDGDTASILSLLASPGGTGISLREAIIAANNTRIGTTPDLIILPVGTYLLTGSGDDNASTGDLDIRDNVIITGDGARATTINAQGTDRVFHILNNSTAIITGLTITGGNAHGGGALVDDGATLNLADVAISGNTSDAGGAVHVHGTLNLNRVTLANNTANAGGALYFHGADGGSLVNVTISGNTAMLGEGGAIWTDSAVTVTNATIANNTGATVGGIYISGGGNVLLKNSILDNNGRNASAALRSGGFNLDSDGTALLGSASDRVAAPFLNPLADNGGPTSTHAPIGGSLALDPGGMTGAPAVDQRGITRDSTPDIGAFEGSIGHIISSLGDSDASANQIAENTANGTVVGITASATDSDGGDTVSYTLTGDADGRFAVNAATGIVTVANSSLLDYEMATSHNITVRATSSDSSFSTRTFTISILPVNDNNPQILSNGSAATAFVNLDENVLAVTTITAADIDLPAQALNYSIDGGADAAQFAINSATGVLTFVMAPNFEVPADAGSDNVYKVTVRVSDGTLTDTQAISVAVTNIDESPTADAGGTYAIFEGDALTVLAGPSADPEGQPLTYAWDVDGDGFFTDASGTTATLTWSQLNSLPNPVIDNGTRTVALRVTDAGGHSIVATTPLTVINTAPTVSVTGNPVTISGAPYVISFSAIDPGADTITTYQINWGDGTTENISRFAASATHTYQTPGGTRNITMTATDEDGIFSMNGGPLVVTVLNTAPSAPTLSDSVVPGLVRGATVGFLTFHDPDFGDSHTWTVSDNRFIVDGSTLKLKPGRLLDPSTEPAVTLNVTVIDVSGASSAAAFTLKVNNVPVSNNDAYAVDGTQQMNVGSSSMGVLGNDIDADGDALSVSLISGPSHAAIFGLNADGTFWYRAATGYSGVDTFRYQVTDGENLGAVTTVALTVNQPASLTYTSLVAGVPEQQTLSSPLKVGAFTVIDDGIGTNTLTLTGTDAALFALDSKHNLFLKSGLTIDFSVQTRFEVTVLLDDIAIAGMPDASRSLVINVQNINDAPVASALPNVVVLEDALPGTINTSSAFADKDGDALNYTVQVVSTAPGLFRAMSINQTTGVISYSLNANAFGTATLRVTARDPSNTKASGDFQFIVQPVNDAPVALGYSGSTLSKQLLTSAVPGVLSSVSDAESDPLSVILVSGPANGIVVLQANGSFIYTPNPDFQGVDTFRFVASDGFLLSNIGTATLSVLPQFNGQQYGSSSSSSGFGTATSTSTNETSGSTSTDSGTVSNSDSGSSIAVNSQSASSSGNSTGVTNGLPLSGVINLAVLTAANESSPNDDGSVMGFVTSAEDVSAKRILVPEMQANFESDDRSASNDFTRRMNNAMAALDFDATFSQFDSNAELSILNAEREAFYRQLAGHVDQQADSVAEQLEQDTKFKGRVVGSVGVVTTGFSVGYLFWAVRLGTLASGLLAQVPAWSMLDPLLVIDGEQKEDDDDKESLQNIMDRQQAQVNKTQEQTEIDQAVHA